MSTTVWLRFAPQQVVVVVAVGVVLAPTRLDFGSSRRRVVVVASWLVDPNQPSPSVGSSNRASRGPPVAYLLQLTIQMAR